MSLKKLIRIFAGAVLLLVLASSAVCASAAHTHTWGDWTVTKEPTCTSLGLKEGSCTVCGLMHSEEIAKKAHSWGEWETVTEATCTAAGLKQRKCSRCGTLEKAAIPASHTWDTTVIAEATCTENGQKHMVCTVCGYETDEVLPAAGHRFGQKQTLKATCTEGGRIYRECGVCGCQKILKETAALGHQWRVTKKVTCGQDGERICNRCKETEAIPATGNHKWKVTQKATCTAAGSELCLLCQETREIPMPDHTWNDGTVDGVNVRVCGVCGKTELAGGDMTVRVVTSDGAVTEEPLTLDGTAARCTFDAGANLYAVMWLSSEKVALLRGQGVETAEFTVGSVTASFPLNFFDSADYAALSEKLGAASACMLQINADCSIDQLVDLDIDCFSVKALLAE